MSLSFSGPRFPNQWGEHATDTLLAASESLDVCMKALPAIKRAWDGYWTDPAVSLELRDLALSCATLERALCAFATQHFLEASSSSAATPVSSSPALSGVSDGPSPPAAREPRPHDWRHGAGLVSYLLFLRRLLGDLHDTLRRLGRLASLWQVTLRHPVVMLGPAVVTSVVTSGPVAPLGAVLVVGVVRQTARVVDAGRHALLRVADIAQSIATWAAGKSAAAGSPAVAALSSAFSQESRAPATLPVPVAAAVVTADDGTPRLTWPSSLASLLSDSSLAALRQYFTTPLADAATAPQPAMAAIPMPSTDGGSEPVLARFRRYGVSDWVGQLGTFFFTITFAWSAGPGHRRCPV